ncbi:Hypothetical protein NATL1_12091 [Prochlorococcus marinus str. NATL1A]|uniref:Protein family PM-3 n=1 Tax=Prochlorococcus marinus (strain NATL1A) TaxID=167555 RepID=A2C2Q7_PROM1|nr:hypothetical protein [Prochlorococcus marinus]ABM75767.1 Hypothetical protein NATL1_12091 [Prochlorococcus marinus str. NATL1A]
MSQLSIKVSAKGEAMIATLQKEIFNRRRKKVTASQVVETLVESGAKSQSDKRYAASWKNLIKDIEKAAKVSEVHGNKPANVSADEWALIISHRTRKTTSAKKVSSKTSAKKTAAKKPVAKKAIAKKAVSKPAPAKTAAKAKVKTSKVKTAVKKVASAQAKKATSSAKSVSKATSKAVSGRPARRARKASSKAVKA